MTGSVVGCAGPAPDTFTTGPDTFTPCSSAPHCVSSQADPESNKHVAPFRFTARVATARKALLDALDSFDAATVQRVESRFVHATFTTSLGFVDDVVFLLQPARRIVDVKSSSRLGYYDFGVNRRRVDALRGRFHAALRAESVRSAD